MWRVGHEAALRPTTMRCALQPSTAGSDSSGPSAANDSDRDPTAAGPVHQPDAALPPLSDRDRFPGFFSATGTSIVRGATRPAFQAANDSVTIAERDQRGRARTSMGQLQAGRAFDDAKAAAQRNAPPLQHL